jgi:diguanylate cyclase (GGDEF)-like protein
VPVAGAVPALAADLGATGSAWVIPGEDGFTAITLWWDVSCDSWTQEAAALREASLAWERANAIEAQRRAVAHLATHDPLTDLPNRALVLEELRLAVAAARRNGARPAVLFIDVNHFKLANEHHGHVAGDEVLVAMAAKLRSVVRDGDVIGRLGGDQFVVVCPTVADEQDALLIATRLIDAAPQPVLAAGAAVRCSVSVGVAVARPDVDADELLRRAELAMYRAKEGNAREPALFDEAMMETAEQRPVLSEELLFALIRKRCGRYGVAPEPGCPDRAG